MLQVQQSLLGAFKACMKLSCRSSGNSNLQLELALMALLQALRGLAGDQGLPAEKVPAMSGKLSKAAAELLQETWEGPEEEAAEGDKGGDMQATSRVLFEAVLHRDLSFAGPSIGVTLEADTPCSFEGGGARSDTTS
jgi:hypothetical protein